MRATDDRDNMDDLMGRVKEGGGIDYNYNCTQAIKHGKQLRVFG